MIKKYNISLKLWLVQASLIFVFCSFHTFKKDEPKHKVKVVVIDAGHGGKDPGCSGHTHNEKTVALAVALKLGKYIEENMKDVKVFYTRKTDVFVELEDRAKLANDNNADLFISIHCNAAGKAVMIKDSKTGKMRAKTFKNSKGKLVVVETANPEPFGSETYVMGLKNEEGKMKVAQRENSVILMEDDYKSKYKGFDPDSEESYIIMSNYTSSYVLQSASLALKIQEQYFKKAGRVDKGVHRQSIWVLWRTSMPSVLTEIGYLTNPEEEKFLGSEKGQEYLASCLFRAFRKYKDEQEGLKKNYDDDFENQKPLENENYKAINEQEKEPVTIDKPDQQKDVTVVKDTKSVPEKDTIIAVDPKKEKEAEDEKKYKMMITLADVNFKNKKYTEALSLYQKADSMKSREDAYPLKRIKEIESITRKAMQEKEEKERLAMEKAKKEAAADSLKKVVVVIPPKADIIFKVQFAISDVEVNTQKKYPNVPEVSFYKAASGYKYTSGNYTSFEEAIKQQAKLRESGYKDCFVAAFNKGVRMDINEAKKLVKP